MSSVLDYLRGRGVPFLVLPDPDATHPEETAERHDVPTDELVRTVVMSNRFGLALMVVPWNRQLDLALARRAMNDPNAQRALDHELDEKMPEFEPEAWPPLGLFLLMPTFVDREVADREQVVFPAGKPGTLVCLQTEELFRDDPGRHHVADRRDVRGRARRHPAGEPVGGSQRAATGRRHRLIVASLRTPYRRWRDIPSRPKPGQRAGTSCFWGRFGLSGPGIPRSGQVAREPLIPTAPPPLLAVLAHPKVDRHVVVVAIARHRDVHP